ncbi:hypothetical protein TNCV_3656261 [Trichonephila clavipes]|nr:hypothetical protein TNCV_3656261 [Trichonephila clavipes]
MIQKYQSEKTSAERGRTSAEHPPSPFTLLCMESHHIAPANLTELWTALANSWQVIPVEHFQELDECMLRRKATVIKARGGPTRY